MNNCLKVLPPLSGEHSNRENKTTTKMTTVKHLNFIQNESLSHFEWWSDARWNTKHFSRSTCSWTQRSPFFCIGRTRIFVAFILQGKNSRKACISVWALSYCVRQNMTSKIDDIELTLDLGWIGPMFRFCLSSSLINMYVKAKIQSGASRLYDWREDLRSALESCNPKSSQWDPLLSVPHKLLVSNCEIISLYI